MSSIFATGTKKRKSPPWCKPGMFTGVPAEIDERPATVHAYAHWKEDIYGARYEVTETIRLTRNPDGDGYYGASSSSGNNVAIQLADTADITIYHLTLILRFNTEIISSWTWHDVDVTFRLPWGTTLLMKTWLPGMGHAETRLLA